MPKSDPFDILALESEPAQRLLADLRVKPNQPLESLSWLRQQVAPELARAILTQARLRAKALEKFPPELVRQWLFDELALEQSSGWNLARYKAERIARQSGAGPVGDLACGIGGDALALAHAGCRVCAVDQNADRLAILEHNAKAMGFIKEIQTRPQTITAAFPVQEFPAWHIDPDRRPMKIVGKERRFHDLEHAEPDRSVIEALLARNPSAAVKASPGLDISRLGWPAEAEWIGEAGELKQVVLWMGNLRDEPEVIRRATGLARWDGSVSVATRCPAVRWTVAVTPLDDLTWPAAAGEPGVCLYEPDAALIRADLVGWVAKRHGLAPVHPRICYLTGPACAEPSLTCFDLLAEVPAELKNLGRELTARRWRCVEVLCRGADVDTTRMQVGLNRQADPQAEPVSVIITRLSAAGNRVVALAARRGHKTDSASGSSSG